VAARSSNVFQSNDGHRVDRRINRKEACDAGKSRLIGLRNSWTPHMTGFGLEWEILQEGRSAGLFER